MQKYCDSFWKTVSSGSHFYIPLLAPETRITIKELALIWAQLRLINLKVSIIKQRLPLFSTEIFWRKKREKPFNFIASRTLKYSLRSTFHFQPLCRRQNSWHLCMPLLFTMLFSLQMCASSHPSIPSDPSYSGQLQACPKWQCRSANSWFSSHDSPLGPIFNSTVKGECSS